jgi:nitrite reductase/ring-hydroxylating ferredoxin subunit
MPRVLCTLADLEATGAKEIVLTKAGARYPVFIVRDGAGVRGYENVCPHARLPLNVDEDRFYDVSRTVLVCVNHGAHFDPVTGICLRGPCKGLQLRVFPVATEGQNIVIAETTPPQ